jgi:Leucine-rich repeat (LRR) protein
MIELVTGIEKLIDLTKLSIAHNRLKEFPELKSKPALKELRLNDNRIPLLPASVAGLKRFNSI